MGVDRPPAHSAPPLRLPSRAQSAHKGTFGRVLLVGGSRGMAGSISLSSIAALHAGSGLVAAAVPDRILETVASFHPAVMTVAFADQDGHFAVGAWPQLERLLGQQSAIGCGPGMGTGSGSVRLVEGLLSRRDIPMVLDADALNIIAEQGWLKEDRFCSSSAARAGGTAPLIWTPHPGELSRLTGTSPGDADGQRTAARELAGRTGAVIVLKGGPTRVFSPPSGRGTDDGEVWTNPTGNPGMATAGCGDVLTGIITSLLGQGFGGDDAAKLAVWWHGRAGDLAAASLTPTGMTAVHLLEKIPTAARDL